MKILLIHSFFSPVGGAEKVFYDTFKLLERHQHQVYVWATNLQPYFEKDYQYADFFTEYNGGTKNFLKNPYKYFYNIQAKKDLKKIIDKVKPDIIHIHTLERVTYSIFEVCKDIPIVLTIHDSGICCPASTLMYKNKTLCENHFCKHNNYLPCILNKCAKNSVTTSTIRSLLVYLRNKKINRVNKFITPTKALKNAVINADIGITEKQITVINNFLSSKEINRPNFANKGYFLYVGGLEKTKGVHYILQAMNTLPKDIKLHIAGKGTEEKHLKNYAEKNNLDNIEFLGFLNREQIKEEYQNCIALIVPSNWFEIFGMINIEAMANGKPVIASNIGGIPEIVEHNKTGLLFEPANLEQLKECILKYWNNPELVTEHGKNGYEKAVTQYSEEKYYTQLIKLYEEAINE